VCRTPVALNTGYIVKGGTLNQNMLADSPSNLQEFDLIVIDLPPNSVHAAQIERSIIFITLCATVDVYKYK
jgi:hypothetical protein